MTFLRFGQERYDIIPYNHKEVTLKIPVPVIVIVVLMFLLLACAATGGISPQGEYSKPADQGISGICDGGFKLFPVPVDNETGEFGEPELRAYILRPAEGCKVPDQICFLSDDVHHNGLSCHDLAMVN